MIKTVFERVEKKYTVTAEQYDALRKFLTDKMTADEHGETFIANLYYDTDTYDLIRHSVDKPVYKEKLRIRGYGKINSGSDVFIEMKKKYKGIVYKRRVKMPYEQARAFLGGHGYAGDTQILREVSYFLRQNPVSPKVYLCYDRTALRGLCDDGLRITFDTGIRFRQSELRLDNGTWGTDLLQPGQVLMEIKAERALPPELSRKLSELRIFPTSFSKYGAAYENYILPEQLSALEVKSSA